MTQMRYLGPGDAVILDGLEIARGADAELDVDQLRRLRADGHELEPSAAPVPEPAAPAADTINATTATKKRDKPAKED